MRSLLPLFVRVSVGGLRKFEDTCLRCLRHGWDMLFWRRGLPNPGPLAWFVSCAVGIALVRSIWRLGANLASCLWVGFGCDLFALFSGIFLVRLMHLQDMSFLLVCLELSSNFCFGEGGAGSFVVLRCMCYVTFQIKASSSRKFRRRRLCQLCDWAQQKPQSSRLGGCPPCGTRKSSKLSLRVP